MYQELTCDAITADYRIFQRRRGHRYSLDDLATAFQAVHAASDVRRACDMGCGIGSVLLMLAWKLPEARVFGIEALDLSADLAERSVAFNAIGDRVTILRGDLRDVTKSWPHGRCDLVTGTPPYLPEGTAIASPDPQRAAARIELRGGVEAYILAGAELLAERGALVLCADGRKPERVLTASAEAGLSPHHRHDVWPHVDAKHPLFSVWTLRGEAAPLEHTELFVRDATGAKTREAHALRTTFGL